MLQTVSRGIPADRAEAIAWADQIVGGAPAVFLDTETTGFGPFAEIVEVAVLSLDGQIVFDSLVRPRRPIPIAATLVHGIDDARVSEAPTWEDISGIIEQILRENVVVAYNAYFDRNMIAQTLTAREWSVPESDWRCAMRAYAAFAEVRSPRGRGFKWHSLDAAASAFGICPGGHRARADADACRQLVQRMAGATYPLGTLPTGVKSGQ